MDFLNKGQQLHYVTGDHRITLMDDKTWVGEISYPGVSAQRVVVERTFVRPEYRGRGLGSQLVAHFVKEAKKHAFTVKLMCPFATLIFGQHPDYQELLLPQDRFEGRKSNGSN